MKVLRLLAWAHLEVGDKPAQALSCIQALKTQSPDSASHPTMSFLTVKALCSLGRHQDAETELLTIVSSNEVTLEICLSAIKVMLGGSSAQQPKQLLPAVRSALGLVQERFADRADVPVQLVKLLLAQEQVCSSCLTAPSAAMACAQ